jgi:hypothetical protein
MTCKRALIIFKPYRSKNMKTLDRRLATLEQAAIETQINLIVQFDDPSDMGAELWCLEDYSEECPRQSWKRRPDESEQDFTDRALREAKRNSIGAAMLIQTDLESDHANA